MPEEEQQEPVAEAFPERVKRFLPLFGKTLLVIALLVAASAGGGVVSWILISESDLLRSTASAALDGDAAIRDWMETGAVVELEPFVVNLADTDSPRYLRVTVSLMVDDKSTVDQVLESRALVSKTRDVILQTLARKTSSEIVHAEGKDLLRSEILTNLEPYYREPRVVAVMFTEFVIQL